MKLLLDTQVFIWLINDDVRLGKQATKLLYDPHNHLSLSYFSIFEMTIKASIGKIAFDPNVIDDLAKMDIELLLPNDTTLRKYKIFNMHNKDPFDNALMGVALDCRLVLITSDAKILATTDSELRLRNALI